ncbi:ABC transporter substrate-binding protein [Halomonas heilongjiangensis]|uniref:ABC transporter substrate-binding protein n=1 Tax=Halomonas heilongjiangensis TaxID=1387883 RepID=A0A2N7TN67_9GAMM|nr:ABC transporter substrate-binding protein [Halomonas heilongjiangensis]PMR69629.1 ABC transporter substrate-binding protein [Halomonas heilongjiangensis]PXX86964.1 ABC transporter substrate-binding protein [Halomonas heilongjiangensis]
MKNLASFGLGLLMTSAMAAAQADDVKIGMITTLSGGGSHLGVDVRDGFMLAIEQSGRDDIEVLIQDDANRPDLAKSLSDEFMQRDNVDILTGIIWSNLAMAVVPSAVRQGVFYLSPNAGPSALAGRQCHENYFNVAWQNDNLHEAMGAYMKGEGFERPILLAPNYPAGTDALAGFKHRYEGEVVDEIYTQMGQTDYAAEIAQIRASGADSLFFFLPGGMGISFMKQYESSGVELPLFGAAFSFDEIIIQAVGSAALGTMNTSQWAYDLDNDANRAFVERFREAYERTPTLYASQGYDTANLILSALDKAHPSDQDAFREALREADFASVRGKFRFGANQHPIQDIHVREVVAGDNGQPTNRLVGLAIEDIQDVYAADCQM